MDKRQPARDDYAYLARRLGFSETGVKVEGPVRKPFAGPSDETPLEKLHRLSVAMEVIAAEIGSIRSLTYRAQLWQQWAVIWRRVPQHQLRQKREGSAPDSAPRC